MEGLGAESQRCPNMMAVLASILRFPTLTTYVAAPVTIELVAASFDRQGLQISRARPIRADYVLVWPQNS
jgi:hypothetical protein